MTIHFEIGLPWLEFICHFCAAAIYIWFGVILEQTDDGSEMPFVCSIMFFVAILLNTIGAHL